jgi:ribosomal protein S18 acetylase RimI-like enzyme
MTEIPYFRTFQNQDLPELEEMIFALYREDVYGERMCRQKVERTVQELLLYPEKGTITMFCVNEVVVGYAIVIYYWSNEYGGNIASIDEYYVKPFWRRKGVGASFLEYVSKAKAGDVKGLQLEVTPVNERAFDYYSRHGFEPTKNRHLFKKL